MTGAWNAFDDIANKYFERHFANRKISSTWNILFAPSFELLAHRFSYGIQFLRFGQAKCHSCIAFIYRHFIYADYRILFEWPFYYIAPRFHRDKTPSFIRQKEKEKKRTFEPHKIHTVCCSICCHILCLSCSYKFLHIKHFYAISNDISIPL